MYGGVVGLAVGGAVGLFAPQYSAPMAILAVDFTVGFIAGGAGNAAGQITVQLECNRINLNELDYGAVAEASVSRHLNCRI